MMYLLLRNNKESGPYSLEDLKAMGLKAYDLVWVDGKSAAWRYPCEIEELSAFAPAVEEQPFDRFYKKSSPVKANNANNNPSVSAKPTGEPSPTPSSSPLFAGEPSTVPGKRIIYVTMPGDNSQNGPVITPGATRETSSRESVRVMAPAYTASTIEDNSSQMPLNEAPAVEFMPRPKKRPASRIIKPLAISVCILALLAAGIFIGLSINKDTLALSSQPKIAAKNVNTDNRQQTPSTTAQQLPVPAITNTAVPLTTNVQTDTVATIIGQASPTEPPVSRTPKTLTSKEKPAAPKNQAFLPPSTKFPTKDSSAGVVPVLHREATRRVDLTERSDNADKDANAAKLNIASQISVGANGYTVGTFGGITDLQVTVTNRSVYSLDLVVVEVQFVQANKKVYKTENLYFRSIGAGSALMQEAPKSSRGIRAQYKIISINSKEGGLSYSGI